MTPDALFERKTERLSALERQAARALERSVERALAEYGRAIGLIEAQRLTLSGRAEDLVVCVRIGPGPFPRVFHKVSGRCGWRPWPANREEIFLGEAFDRGLRGCKSCARSIGPPAPGDQIHTEGGE